MIVQPFELLQFMMVRQRSDVLRLDWSFDGTL